MHTSTRGLVAATLLAGVTLAATPAFADDTPASPITITGSAGIVSQYRFRGLAQSDNKPVFQGSFTISHSSGFYIATWGSSASAGSAPINIGGTEIDLYGGYTHAIGKTGFTFDGGLYGYVYPGATAGNYFEAYGSLTKSYGPFTAKGGVNFAPAQHVFNINFTSPSRKNWYIYGELGASVPKTPISFHSHFGHTAGGFEYGRPYWDYTVGVTYKWKALAFDVSWVGTDLGQGSVANRFGGRNNLGLVYCGPTTSVNCYDFYRMAKNVGVASITASF